MKKSNVINSKTSKGAKSDLTEGIIPFWLGDAIVWENGGIFTCLDEKGEI